MVNIPPVPAKNALSPEDALAAKTILECIQKRAGKPGVLSFRDFMEIALYTPQHGYYRRNASRVGRSRQTDFYTAESLGPVFARLVCQAAVNLLAAGKGPAPKACTFVELGAEPGQSPFAAVAPSWFASYQTLRMGDPMELEGTLVVFANELLDAQPFHRLVHHEGIWHECGVHVQDGALKECLLPAWTPPLLASSLDLPPQAPEGYRLDISLDAPRLVREIMKQPWHGLVLLADYGRTWQELIRNCPSGTARAYFRHTVSNDLLARPGQQDLTCHVCWDSIIDAMAPARQPTLERQEAFLIKHAAQAIEAIVNHEPGTFHPERQILSELLHPHHMGSRFQFLTAMRGPDNSSPASV